VLLLLLLLVVVVVVVVVVLLLLLLLLLPMCLRSVSFAERRVRVCLRVRCLSGDAGAR